jgi:hypothetical protein
MTYSIASVERTRISEHILGAERSARRARTDLDPLRTLVRSLLLDELAAYRQEGLFPRNTTHRERTPFFVDDLGTPCAVAHLLNASGAHTVTQRIARTRNNARVAALASEPALVAWLEATGLSLHEAAAIQPGYSYAPADCICGGPFTSVGYEHILPAAGVLDAHIVDVPTTSGVYVVVDATYGDVGTLAVGQQVHVRSIDGLQGQLDATPRRVLVLVDSTSTPADGGEAARFAITVSAEGEWQCRTNHSPVASLDTTIEALTAPSCATVLAAENAAWTKTDGGPNTSGKVGCGVSQGGTDGTLAILLALVAFIAARRRTARRRV